jgi:hypothetical protein
MLDRSQHLRLFLTGSKCSPEEVTRILSDESVNFEVNQQPVDAVRLLKAVNLAAPNISLEEQAFLAVFGRYRSARAG